MATKSYSAIQINVAANTLGISANTTMITVTSGTLQTQIDNLPTSSYVNTLVATTSGTLQTQITANTSDSHAESHSVASHSDTTATGSELNTLTSGGDTTLHDHDGISENTSARHAESHAVSTHSDTSATGSELNELTDGSDTILHNHAGIDVNAANIATASGTMSTHAGLTNNPHSVTAGQLGAQVTSEKAQASGYASLDGDGKVPSSQLPSLVVADVSVVADETAQLALVDQQEGDIAVRTDESKSYIHNGGSAGTMADWTELLAPPDTVVSVNGETGAVSLDNADIGLGNVENISILTTSGTLQTAIDANTSALHSESHSVASHSDTSATGSELNTLTGGGNTTLHNHAGIAINTALIATTSGSLQSQIDVIPNSSYVDAGDAAQAALTATTSGTLQTQIMANTSASHAESHDVASHNDTSATGTELNELTGGGDTTLHDHAGISENTSARHAESHAVSTHSDTSATGSELNELTDGSDTVLHNHAGIDTNAENITTLSGIVADSIGHAQTTASDISGTYVPDTAAYNHYKLTATADTVISNPTTNVAGHKGVIMVHQNASGSHTVTFGDDWVFGNGQPDIDETAFAVNVFEYAMIDTKSQGIRAVAEFITSWVPAQ